MILTDNDIDELIIQHLEAKGGYHQFAHLVEAAVIRKLATVSVEPDLIKTDEVDRYGDSIYIEAYSAEALAAARVQENERIRKCLEMFASLMDEAAKLIGQIPTDDIEKLSGYRWPLCDELGGAAAIARDEIHALIGGKE